MKSKHTTEETQFSIIVPVLHESDNINPLIEHLESLEGDASPQIIVVDGSPDRDTIKAIKSKKVIKVSAPKGRGRQMNAGASVAKGKILLFLHADTKLPRNALRKVSFVMAKPQCAAGAFTLDIDSSQLTFKLIAKVANLRCRLNKIPYGDQAIFMRREYFNRVGGYEKIPLMEDVELMRRIKRRGGRICVLPDRITTSSRRWKEEGLVYVVLRNPLLLLLYGLGVSPEKLASFYKTTYKRAKV